jgi:DNA-binding transcriptional LysR family regulator
MGANLNWQPFVEEPLVLVTSTEITENDPLVVLREQPYIHHTRRGAVGLLVEACLAANNISVRFSMEMESIESLTSMVSHNLGVSIVPDICVPDPMFSKLRKIPLPSGSGTRTLGLLSRSDCSKLRLVDRLLEQVKQVVLANKAIGL